MIQILKSVFSLVFSIGLGRFQGYLVAFFGTEAQPAEKCTGNFAQPVDATAQTLLPNVAAPLSSAETLFTQRSIEYSVQLNVLPILQGKMEESAEYS